MKMFIAPHLESMKMQKMQKQQARKGAPKGEKGIGIGDV